MTSHAAVVARGMGTCCVSGCGDIRIDEEAKYFDPGRQSTSKRATGFPSTAPPATSTASQIPTVEAGISGEFGRIMAWADQYRTLQVRTNADTPARRPSGRSSSAREGIGLCRTEHMFFDADRIAGHPRDDCLRDRRAAGTRAEQDSSRCSRATSRPSTRPWRAAR